MASGDLDSTFGTLGGEPGVVRFDHHPDVGRSGFVTDAVLQPDGKIVTVGFGSNRKIELVRFGPGRRGLFAYRPDPSFGAGGYVVDDFGSDPISARNLQANAMAIQPDGKLVVVGWGHVGTSTTRAFIVARYLSNGTPDPEFGPNGNGHVVSPLHAPQPLKKTPAGELADRRLPGGEWPYGEPPPLGFRPPDLLDQVPVAEAYAVVVDAAARIIVAGRAFNPANPAADEPGFSNIGLVRYLPNGQPDLDFGVRGMVTRFSISGIADAIVLQTDGKILVAGHSIVPDSVVPVTGTLDEQYVVARFLDDGAVDSSFGRGGAVTEPFTLPNTTGPRRAHARAIILQPDGKIVVSGQVRYRRGSSTEFVDIGLARYHADGAPDESFGTDGRLLLDLSGPAHGRHRVFASAIGGSGLVYNAAPRTKRNRTLVVGDTVRAVDNRLVAVVARLRPNGELDPAYGQSGDGRVSIADGDINVLLAQPDGKIVAAGGIGAPTSRIFLARLRA